MNAEDLALVVLGDPVTLKGEQRDEAGENGHHYRKERPVGSFAHTVTLPAPVDPNSVKAECRNGVLIVYMEKEEKAKAEKVAIKS